MVGLVAVDGVHLRRIDVLQPPGKQHHLLADIIHQIFRGDVVATRPHAPGQGVADDGVARPAHVDRSGGIDGGVLQQHLFRLVLPAAVVGPLAQNGADGGGGQRCLVHIEVQIAVLSPGPRYQFHGRQFACRLLGDGDRRLAQDLGQGEARDGQVGDAGGRRLDIERRLNSHGAERLLGCALRLGTELAQGVHYITPVVNLSMAAKPPKAFMSISPSSESTESSSTVVPTFSASS